MEQPPVYDCVTAQRGEMSENLKVNMKEVDCEDDMEVQVVEEKVNRIFRCPVCKTFFLSQVAYESHFQSKHLSRMENSEAPHASGVKRGLEEVEGQYDSSSRNADSMKKPRIISSLDHDGTDLTDDIKLKMPENEKISVLERVNVEDIGKTCDGTDKSESILQWLHKSEYARSLVTQPVVDEDIPLERPMDQQVMESSPNVNDSTSTVAHGETQDSTISSGHDAHRKECDDDAVTLNRFSSRDEPDSTTNDKLSKLDASYYACNRCSCTYSSVDQLTSHAITMHIRPLAQAHGLIKSGKNEKSDCNLPAKQRRRRKSEKKYCLCNTPSWGEMIGCDNPFCKLQWFHFPCVGVITAPEGKWYCPTCREL